MPTPEELSLRRRIVYHGLKPYLPDATVPIAVKLCDDEFRRELVFPVSKFLTRLAELDSGVAAERLKLYGALQKLRGLKPDEIGPDPLTPADTRTPLPQNRSRLSAPSGADGWPVVFNAVLAGLADALGRINPEYARRMTTHAAMKAGGLGVSPVTNAAVVQWMKSGKAAFGPATTKKEMHGVLHTLYVWGCEELGPVVMDRQFGRVLKEVETLPEAALCPPQSLL